MMGFNRMQLLEDIINSKAKKINDEYHKEIIDQEKIQKGIHMIADTHEFSTITDQEEFISYINTYTDKLINKVIKDYEAFIAFIEKINKQPIKQQLAVLDMPTDHNGIYLSPLIIDLLIITELRSKADIKNYVENICGQFPSKKVEEVIDNFHELDLETAKKALYQAYQDSLISYLDSALMTSDEKIYAKLSKMGINDNDITICQNLVSENKISEAYKFLGDKYGNDFITKFNRVKSDDYENVKAITYDEVKSLSELISNDPTLDTIIVISGKYDSSIYETNNGLVFDPYQTNKALNYCINHNKHMRYHALFDQSHVDNLIKNGKGIKDHDEILAAMKSFIKASMAYIEKNNRDMPDGRKLIDTIEIFNEVIEKYRNNKKGPYENVWEKYFGITPEEMLACFEGIKKPDGVNYMYNETSLTESPEKRAAVQKFLYQIETIKPGFIDTFGNQDHLSDEDIMTETGRMNLADTGQMLNRINHGKLIVDSKDVLISPKKTECTEFDFCLTESFQNNFKKADKNDMWITKIGLINEVSNIYKEARVTYNRITYWNTFSKNDHNVVRKNNHIQKDNKIRINKGLEAKPLIDTMHGGLIKDGKTFDEVKTLKTTSKDLEVLKWDSTSEKKKYEWIKAKNEAKINSNISQDQTKLTLKPKDNKNNNSSAGFASALIVTLLTGFAGGMIATIIYFLMCK